MSQKISSIVFFAAMLSPAYAYTADISGAWKTIDDNSGKPRSIVRIDESGGQFEGVVEKLFLEPNEDPKPLCDKCHGAHKGRPILGMKIINQMKRVVDEYRDGTIMDPDNGKFYNCKMWVEDGGKKLKVRGYIGPFYRTQTWLRAE